MQYPGASGRVLDPRPLIEAAHERDALVVVAADLLALTLLEAPGELGADVVVGSSQRFGVRCSTAARTPASWPSPTGLERHLPGRLVGVSVDAEGRPAYRLALQTREQHIRRDKATSNICTAQVLLAVVASMYAVYHGPEGLRAIATRAHRYAAVLAAALREGGVEVEHDEFFDTLSVLVPGRAEEVVAVARVARAAPAARRRRPRRHLHLRDHHPVDADQRAAGVRRLTADVDARRRGHRRRVARARCAARRRTSPTRCSRPTTARPRCCATCAGSRAATTRWTAA